jgi:transcriptional regulator with XRE-family HTH domain
VKGAEVTKIRKALGLTQVQLAEELGVAPNSVARWERDEMGIRPMAERLMRMLVKAAKGKR